MCVDEALAPLIEALWRHGIATVYSCEDAPQPDGVPWRDKPDEPRFYVVFPDADEFRKLVPYLDISYDLACSAYCYNDAPRWEYRLSVQKGSARLNAWADHDVRLQVAVFVPRSQLTQLVDALV